MAAAAIEAALQASIFTDASLVLGNAAGVTHIYNQGTFNENTVIDTFSAQKWIVATVLLRELDERTIGLDAALHAYPSPLDFATTTDPRGAVTARGLLSFTSGFETNPLCASLPSGSLSNCAATIAQGTYNASRRFSYGTYHLTLLSAALGSATSEHFQDMFTRFRGSTGLFANSNYKSAEKPFGFQTSAVDYAEFLVAHLNGTLLPAAAWTEMLADQSKDAEVIASPATGFEGNWEYGFGNWVRCDSGSPCQTVHHSAGARGYLPWIDLDTQTFGVLAVSGTGGDYDVSVPLRDQIADSALILSK